MIVPDYQSSPVNAAEAEAEVKLKPTHDDRDWGIRHSWRTLCRHRGLHLYTLCGALSPEYRSIAYWNESGLQTHHAIS